MSTTLRQRMHQDLQLAGLVWTFFFAESELGPEDVISQLRSLNRSSRHVFP